MSKNTWDAILASTPLNRTAGAVTGKGEHYESSAKLTNLNWDSCPPLAPHPRGATTFVDLTGRRFGRFTVIGYAGKLNPKKKAVWVCKCACGRYEGRHGSAITSANPNSKCQACDHMALLQKHGSSDRARNRASSPKAALNTIIRNRETAA